MLRKVDGDIADFQVLSSGNPSRWPISTDGPTTTIGLSLTQFSDLANNVYQPCKHK